MNIRVAMLDNDFNYLSKISRALNMKYKGKIELYIFTDKEMLLETIKNDKVDVLIVNKQLLDFNELELEYKFSKAYFCESPNVESIDGFYAVNKYQKIEEIYNCMKKMYEDVSGVVDVVNKSFSQKTTLIMYTSFCGGTGTSTIAISEAISKAKIGYKVMYLNLEYFDTTDMYFKNVEQPTFSNLVFELKKKNNKVVSKLQNIFQKDVTGVYYCSPSKILLDKLEIFNMEDIRCLFDALKDMDFDYIIIDKNISFTPEERLMFELSDQIRFVVDGRKITNHKFLKLMNSLALLDQRENVQICDKVGIVYNKMSSTFNNTIDNQDIPILATVHKYKTQEDKIIIEEIVSQKILQNI